MNNLQTCQKDIFIISSYFRQQNYLELFNTMGCNASDAGNPHSSAFGGKSPSKDCLNEENKRKFRKIIQKDDIKDFIVTVAELATPLNAEISEPGLKWMMTHLACRYDSNKCLEYLLRNYFVEFASIYINYANAPTIEGYSALHMCAMWKSEKCFNTLMYYGGLSLTSVDKNAKVPLDLAIQNKSKKIVDALNFYKEKGINFTLLETQKFLNGDIISQDPSKNQDKELLLDKKKQQKIQVVQTEEQKRLKQEKKRLEEQADLMLKQKLKRQAQLEAQKAQSAKNAQKNKLQEEQRLKLQRQAQDKFEHNLKLEREKYKKQMQMKEQQLKRIKQQLRKVEEDKIEAQKQKAQKQAQQFAKQQEQRLKQKLKDKNDALDKMKQKDKIPENPEQNQQQEQKEEPQINQQQCLNALKAAFEAIQQELPPKLEESYKKALQEGNFFDEEFPAALSSLGDQNNQRFGEYRDSIVWLRPYEIFGEDVQLQVFEGIDSNDIQQGELGVCYMLAAISALAANPQNIEKMFIYTDTNVGFYVIRLYINGVPKFFQIDDQIPCNVNTNFPIFSQPVGTELWVMLMEKCWAKAIGSYLSAEGMVPHEMMEDLSGSPSFGKDFEDPNGKMSTQQIMEDIVRHLSKDSTIVVSSKSNPPEGIAQDHAYTLLKIFKIGQNYILKIRNPWGEFQYNGQYSEGSPSLTPAIKKQIGWTNEEDGIFFLSQSQVVQSYEYYSVNFNLKDHFYSYIEFSSNANEDKFFKFTLTKKSLTNVKLNQQFYRMVQDQNYNYSPVIIEVAKIEKNNKVKFLGQGDFTTFAGEKATQAFEDVCKDLDAGDYFVRVRMLWINDQSYNTAVLSVYSGEYVDIEELEPQQAAQYMRNMYLGMSPGLATYPSQDGIGTWKLLKMKGEMAFIIETNQAGNFMADFRFNQAEGTVAQLYRVDDNTISVPVSKSQPGVGTFAILDLNNSSLQDGALTFRRI